MNNQPTEPEKSANPLLNLQNRIKSLEQQLVEAKNNANNIKHDIAIRAFSFGDDSDRKTEKLNALLCALCELEISTHPFVSDLAFLGLDLLDDIESLKVSFTSSLKTQP